VKKIFSKLIHESFEIGILLKFFHGLFEVLVGIFLATPGRLVTDNLIIALTQQEISEDPDDLIANYLIKIGKSISPGINLFAVFYLIFHGIVNLLVATALLKNKIWAYPLAMVIFGLFVIYQIYRYFHTHSLMMLVLTLFDVFIVTVIFLEYKKKRKGLQKL
jgi:uncharacterized membrane protein